MGRTACTEPQCLYKGALYLYLTVELYLYSPYGPSWPLSGVNFTFTFTVITFSRYIAYCFVLQVLCTYSVYVL